MPIPFTCPHCGHETLVDDKYAGDSGKCIKCDASITVPLGNTPGAVVPEEKVDLTGGSAAGVALTCGVVLIVFALLSVSGLGMVWIWWGLGFGW
jgi:hypothetical protein